MTTPTTPASPDSEREELILGLNSAAEYLIDKNMAHDASTCRKAAALLAATPARGWVGLTDAEIWGQADGSDGSVPKFARAIESKLREKNAAAPAAPVDMVLYCPKCGVQHIDAPDERTPDWTNPPHKSHLCHGCGHIWRPSDTPTNGVARTASGKDADTAPAAGGGEAVAYVDHADGSIVWKSKRLPGGTLLYTHRPTLCAT